MLPLNKFRIKNIKGGEATFDKRFFRVLGYVFLCYFRSGVLNKSLL
jgi:hypothetical protein